MQTPFSGPKGSVSPSALLTEPCLQPALASPRCNEIKVSHIRHLLGKCRLLYGHVEMACSLPPISSLCSPVALTAANLFAASLRRGKALLTFLPWLPVRLTLTPGTTAQARGGRHLEVLCLLAPVFSFCSWDLAQPGSQPRPARGKGGSPVTPAPPQQRQQTAHPQLARWLTRALLLSTAYTADPQSPRELNNDDVFGLCHNSNTVSV